MVSIAYSGIWSTFHALDSILKRLHLDCTLLKCAQMSSKLPLSPSTIAHYVRMLRRKYTTLPHPAQVLTKLASTTVSVGFVTKDQEYKLHKSIYGLNHRTSVLIRLSRLLILIKINMSLVCTIRHRKAW